MADTKKHDREMDDGTGDTTGTDTHSANTGVVVPNDAALYDPDYDPGASEPSAELAREFEEKGPGLPDSSNG